jgi:two-component system chemotaxis response regulator CheY
MIEKDVDKQIEGLGILLVDENQYMRKITRAMLMNIGANPDIVIMDWTLPLLNGPQVLKIVRAPGVFPKPQLPIILLTASTQRSLVLEALRLGVHEFLVKPTSPKSLRERLVSILVKPRAMVRIGDCYVPEPRGMLLPSELQQAA